MKLALNTTVLTSKGFKNFQALMPEDLVVTKDGTHEEVQKTDHVMSAMVELTLSNGDAIVTALDQSIEVQIGTKKQLITAEEILETTKNIFIPAMKEPLEFSEKFVEIHPYILGLWYGIGSFDRGRLIIKPDDVNGVRKFILDHNLTIKVDILNNKTGFNFVTFEGLDHAITFNGLNPDRHIPHKYLHNTKENRLWLLMGIMDTMGETTDKKTYTITDKSVEFLNDMKFLISSFGLIGTIVNDTLTFETNIQIHNLPNKLNEVSKKLYKYKVTGKNLLDETLTKDVEVSSVIVGTSLVGI